MDYRRGHALAKLSVVSLRIVLCFVVGALAAVPSAHADEPAYLRGYLNALLDTRFPGFGVRVRHLDPQGRVMLYTESCLGPWQRRTIASLIQETGRVTEVIWDRRTDCEATATDVPGSADINFDIRALPESAMFAPLIADPRQPRFSMSYQRYHVADDSFNAGSVAFGEYFGLASGFLGRDGSSQIALQGAVFALFNLDAPSNDLVNADYWIGVPVSYRDGRWSYLVRVYHQSSHLGDEFLLGNPQVTRVNLSYEDLEGIASYEWERTRVYAGVGYILNSEPDIAHPHARLGAEFIAPGIWREFEFIAGLDWQASEELDWSINRAYQAGLEFRSGQRRIRLMLEHFSGHSPNGQFFREHLRYDGLGLYFGF